MADAVHAYLDMSVSGRKAFSNRPAAIRGEHHEIVASSTNTVSAGVQRRAWSIRGPCRAARSRAGQGGLIVFVLVSAAARSAIT